MPIDTPPPKYVAIINALQARIEAGTYPGGSLLPSEHALVQEFDASRSTVVRALEFLRERGWVEARQGKGRIVLGSPPPPAKPMPERVHTILAASEETDGTLLAVSTVAAAGVVASALHLPDGAAVTCRRLLVRGGASPIALRNTYVPVELAAVTGLAGREPLREGLLAHLRRHRIAAPDRIVERLSARPPTTHEATHLEIGPRDCLLTASWSIEDRTGRALLAVDAAFPATRRALEDTFRAT